MSLSNLDMYHGGWLCLGGAVGAYFAMLEDIAKVAAGKKDSATWSRVLAGALVAATLVMMSGA